jgi:hypothetical protein
MSMLQAVARMFHRARVACVLSMLAVQSSAARAQQVTLAAQAQTNAAVFRGQVGRHLTFVCPAHVNIKQDVWGTDVYTDTSPICTAAAHAGVFTRGISTAVTIVMEADKPSFTASTRNSVKSLAYGPWSGSYSFVRNGQPGQIDWHTTIAAVADDYVAPITLVCPPAGQAEKGEIWGTDVYPDDSAICVAGVHAGAIPFTGGTLTVTRVAKQASFPSTTRNGITSKMWADPAWRSYPQPYSVAAAKVDAGVSGGSAPFAVTVTPSNTGPVVTWTAAPQATGYIVSRSKIDDLNCCNITSGRTYTATSPWQDSPLPVSGTYLYKVTATTPTGSLVAEAQFGFRMPGDNTAVGTPTVNAVLVQPTTTGTITPMTTTTPTGTTGTIVTERAPGGGTPTSMNAPPPTNLRFTGVPPIVRISWDPPAGVSSYGINWKPAGSATWNLSPKPLPSTLTDFDFRIEDPAQTYTYQVLAYQADGRYGTVSGDFKPTPLEPTGFTATAIGPGQVRFEWDNIEKQFPSYLQLGRTTTYLLSGPGTGNGVMVVGSSKSLSERNTYTLQGIPAGLQTWTLTVAWPAVITPSTSWPKASVTVPAVAADPVPRYRLVALGFRALQQSKDIDDARDGHGDEVYFSAIVNRTQ